MNKYILKISVLFKAASLTYFLDTDTPVDQRRSCQRASVTLRVALCLTPLTLVCRCQSLFGLTEHVE